MLRMQVLIYQHSRVLHLVLVMTIGADSGFAAFAVSREGAHELTVLGATGHIRAGVVVE